jgi:tRNA(fMet)-specific endonuclease VapC
MLYVLDTNTIAYFFRGQGRVAQRMLEHAPSNIAVPAVVEYEIRYGLAKARGAAARLKQVEDFVGTAIVLPFGSAEAAAAAQVRVGLERKGIPIGPHDILIAGTALAHRATLVTHNTAEFSRIDGLRLEDWY